MKIVVALQAGQHPALVFLPLIQFRELEISRLLEKGSTVETRAMKGETNRTGKSRGRR
jgi:hypothetical protein